MKKYFGLLKELAIKAMFCSFLLTLYQNTLLGQEYHGGNTPPAYSGGNKALKEFIDKNMIYPDTIKNAGVYGTVVVSFLIDKDGKVENVKLLRGLHAVCDSEAIRITRSMHGWQPAINFGKPISCNILLPIEFRLENNYSTNKPFTITGTITEKNTGKPVEAALIIIKGTNIGTISDVYGRYKLEITGENCVLEISSMGYKTCTEQVKNNRTINVELDMEYHIINFNMEN
jgi:protein TonB